MRCPTLTELSPPPPDKTGWPWTEESEPLPDKMPDGSPWPKVSIVTPSYNQGQFLDETIRSVLLQGYPNLEYIIIDGGSTDDSIEIIREYEPWLTYWVSEQDRGQAHAINKGIGLSTGEVFGWLNSDDVYISPRSIAIAVRALKSYPSAHAVTGSGVYIDEESRWLQPIVLDRRKVSRFWLKRHDMILQPATLFAMHAIRRLRCDESLHYAFDWDLLIRLSGRYTIVPIGDLLAGYRTYPSSKTQSGGRERTEELRLMARKYLGNRSWQFYLLCLYTTSLAIVEKLPAVCQPRARAVIHKASWWIREMTAGKVTSL